MKIEKFCTSAQAIDAPEKLVYRAAPRGTFFFFFFFFFKKKNLLDLNRMGLKSGKALYTL